MVVGGPHHSALHANAEALYLSIILKVPYCKYIQARTNVHCAKGQGRHEWRHRGDKTGGRAGAKMGGRTRGSTGARTGGPEWGPGWGAEWGADGGQNGGPFSAPPSHAAPCSTGLQVGLCNSRCVNSARRTRFPKSRRDFLVKHVAQGTGEASVG